MAELGFSLVMNFPVQANGYAAAWTAPEILDGSGAISQEADVFAFGMVVVEVGPRALPLPTLEVEGWIFRLMSESSQRFLQEGVRLVISQPRSLVRRFWVANARPVRRRGKNSA